MKPIVVVWGKHDCKLCEGGWSWVEKWASERAIRVPELAGLIIEKAWLDFPVESGGPGWGEAKRLAFTHADCIDLDLSVRWMRTAMAEYALTGLLPIVSTLVLGEIFTLGLKPAVARLGVLTRMRKPPEVTG